MNDLLAIFATGHVRRWHRTFCAGCNVGPKYVRPNVTAPPAYRGADDTAVSSDAKETSLGDEQWAAGIS